LITEYEIVLAPGSDVGGFFGMMFVKIIVFCRLSDDFGLILHGQVYIQDFSQVIFPFYRYPPPDFERFSREKIPYSEKV